MHFIAVIKFKRSLIYKRNIILKISEIAIQSYVKRPIMH